MDDEELLRAYRDLNPGAPTPHGNPGHIAGLRRIAALAEQETAELREEIARLNSELDYWSNR